MMTRGVLTEGVVLAAVRTLLCSMNDGGGGLDDTDGDQHVGSVADAGARAVCSAALVMTTIVATTT